MVTIFPPTEDLGTVFPAERRFLASLLHELQRKGRSRVVCSSLFFPSSSLCLSLKFTPFLSHSYRRQRVKTGTLYKRQSFEETSKEQTFMVSHLLTVGQDVFLEIW